MRYLHLALLCLPVTVGAFSSRAHVVPRVGAPKASRPTRWAIADDVCDAAEDAENTLQDKVQVFLGNVDRVVLPRIIRIGNHAPALVTLAYFGLMSMNMGGMNSIGGDSALATALVSKLGETTNAQFSGFFPTLVTPATWVFYAWPAISLLQFLTVGASAIRFGNPLLSQCDLTALSLANLAAAAWLVVSSRTVSGALPLASFLILPVIPFVSGFPLRVMRRNPRKTTWKNAAFQLYSSFTTIATLLAITVELQYGGRIPLPVAGRGEAVAALFLGMYAFLVRLPGQGAIKRSVNAFAITGILAKRIMDGLTWKKCLSVSFLGTVAVALMAINKIPWDEDEDKGTWDEDTTVDDVSDQFEPDDED